MTDSQRSDESSRLLKQLSSASTKPSGRIADGNYQQILLTLPIMLSASRKKKNLATSFVIYCGEDPPPSLKPTTESTLLQHLAQ